VAKRTKRKLSKKQLKKAGKIAEAIKRDQPGAVKSGKINPFAVSRAAVKSKKR